MRFTTTLIERLWWIILKRGFILLIVLHFICFTLLASNTKITKQSKRNFLHERILFFISWVVTHHNILIPIFILVFHFGQERVMPWRWHQLKQRVRWYLSLQVHKPNMLYWRLEFSPIELVANAAFIWCCLSLQQRHPTKFYSKLCNALCLDLFETRVDYIWRLNAKTNICINKISYTFQQLLKVWYFFPHCWVPMIFNIVVSATCQMLRNFSPFITIARMQQK